MKKQPILLLALFCLSLLTNAQDSKSLKDILGKWQGEDVKSTGTLEFTDSVNVIIVINGQNPMSFRYTIDFTKKPIPLTLTLNNETKFSFLQFINNDKLKWQVFPNAAKPTNFVADSINPIMILKRVK
jgi:hypothetical protein